MYYIYKDAYQGFLNILILYKPWVFFVLFFRIVQKILLAQHMPQSTTYLALLYLNQRPEIWSSPSEHIYMHKKKSNLYFYSDLISLSKEYFKMKSTIRFLIFVNTKNSLN